MTYLPHLAALPGQLPAGALIVVGLALLALAVVVYRKERK